MSLARKIRADGYDVVFSCAPNERPYWVEKLNNNFELPEFKSINLFAEYLYESALLIGNDSGAGHLASAMGIPVVTLVTGPKKKI
jgi:ADP-heptose:LPS heptosyltransferase